MAYPTAVKPVAYKPPVLTKAPTPAPAPAPAPRPTTTMAPAPPGSTITRTAATIPGYGSTPGFTDIRSQLVTAPVSPLQQQSQSMLSNALNRLQTASAIPGYQPVAGPNFGQANNWMNQAAGAAQGAHIGNVDASSPEAQRLRAMSMASLDGLSDAPDRAALAAEALRIQRELTLPQWEQDLRHVGQQAAALGRIGSGMTTNELTDVTLAREKALGLYGQQLANDAAGLALQDRLNVFDRTAGLQGQFSGQDLSRAGLDLQAQQARANLAMGQAGLLAGLGGQSANMAQASAGFAADQAARHRQAMMDQAALQQQLVNSLAGIQGQQFSQGMQSAGLRTQQQQWQNQLQQQAVQNAVQQQQLQDQLLNSQFQRQLAGANALGSLGFGSNPFALQLAGSQYQQGQANSQSAALAQLAQQQALAQQLAALGRTGSSAPIAGIPAMYGQQPGTYYYGAAA